MRITTYVLIGILLGVVAFTVIIKKETSKCREAMSVMQGTDACMNTLGCFFDASHIIEAQRAYEHHKRSCKKPSA